VDGEQIACWGDCRRTVHAGGRRFSVHFLKANVAFPILGANEFGLILNVRKQTLTAPRGKFFLRLDSPVVAATSFSVVVPHELCHQERQHGLVGTKEKN
jgi:hypothetical protein